MARLEMEKRSSHRKLEEDSASVLPPLFPLRRIVLLHQGALGDFLLALPAFDAIHQAQPGIRIDFWSKPDHVALIASRPYTGAAITSGTAALSPFYHDDLWRETAIPSFLDGAEAVLVFGQKSSRELCSRLSTRLARPVHWIQSFPEPGHIQPVTQFILDQLKRLGWARDSDAAPQGLEPLHSERESIREWLSEIGWTGAERPILIHPGSGGYRKVWPLARWWGVLQRLQREGHHVILTLGPADEPLQLFAEAAEGAGAKVMAGIPLTRLSALLAESRLYMGCDSGVSHLAAAVGATTLVIFGPTNPNVWGPIGKRVWIATSRWEEQESLKWPAKAIPDAEILQMLESLMVETASG